MRASLRRNLFMNWIKSYKSLNKKQINKTKAFNNFRTN